MSLLLENRTTTKEAVSPWRLSLIELTWIQLWIERKNRGQTTHIKQLVGFHWISSSETWRRKCPSHLIVVQIIKQNQKMASDSVVPSKQMGFPGGSEVKNPPANAGELGSIPGSGRSPGEGNGNPLQYSCLGNPIDQGAWQATVHGVVEELDMTEWLNNTE